MGAYEPGVSSQSTGYVHVSRTYPGTLTLRMRHSGSPSPSPPPRATKASRILLSAHAPCHATRLAYAYSYFPSTFDQCQSQFETPSSVCFLSLELRHTHTRAHTHQGWKEKAREVEQQANSRRGIIRAQALIRGYLQRSSTGRAKFLSDITDVR